MFGQLDVLIGDHFGMAQVRGIQSLNTCPIIHAAYSHQSNIADN